MLQNASGIRKLQNRNEIFYIFSGVHFFFSKVSKLLTYKHTNINYQLCQLEVEHWKTQIKIKNFCVINSSGSFSSPLYFFLIWLFCFLQPIRRRSVGTWSCCCCINTCFTAQKLIFLCKSQIIWITEMGATHAAICQRFYCHRCYSWHISSVSQWLVAERARLQCSSRPTIDLFHAVPCVHWLLFYCHGALSLSQWLIVTLLCP